MLSMADLLYNSGLTFSIGCDLVLRETSTAAIVGPTYFILGLYTESLFATFFFSQSDGKLFDNTLKTHPRFFTRLPSF